MIIQKYMQNLKSNKHKTINHKQYKTQPYMDTDNLSKESYDGIIVEAEKLTHDLALHYGLLSYDCKDEAEYLDKAGEFTRELMQVKDYELDDLFLGNPTEKEKLNFTLQKIISNIEKIKKIPIEK